MDINLQSEINYIIDHFEEHFENWKGSRIVLHGALESASAIISHFHHEYQFEGIIPYDDSQNAERLGLRVLTQDDLADGCELIILTEFRKYAEKAFFDLTEGHCEDNFHIYSMYGVDLKEAFKTAKSQGYLGLGGLKECTRPYDVISLMILNTLTEDENGEIIPLKIRPRFRLLIRWLEENGKTIIFVGRKKYSDDFFVNFLIQEGFCKDAADAKERYFCRTNKDLNFRALIERFQNKKILHIGTDILNDCIVPKRYGIDTVHMVRNPLEVHEVVLEKYNKAIMNENCIRKLLEKAKDAELVSFDIFDTLLIRKVLYPEDVYEYLDFKLKKKGIVIEDFVSKRKQVAREIPYGTLEDYYRHPIFQGVCVKELENVELQAECELIMPRMDIVRLFHELRKQNKRIVLTSDMHLTTEQLRSLLKQCGVDDYENIFVSCEYRCLKREGLFEKVLDYAECPGNRILHIGDHEEADLETPQYYGIQSEIVPRISELAYCSGWEGAFKHAKTFQERCLLGLSISRIFSNLTESNVSSGSGYELSRFIVSAMGPMITGYLTKLIMFAKENSAEKICFVSRDGWLLKKIYNQLKVKIFMLSEDIYFYINRHAAFLTVCDDFSHIPLILSMAGSLTPEQILERYYGLGENSIKSWSGKGDITEYIKTHIMAIQSNAFEQRRNLMLYLDRIGLSNIERCIFVDFVSADTTRSYLKQATGINLIPLYFGVPWFFHDLGDVNYYCETENVAFLNHYMEMETYLTSPEPSLDRWDESGAPVFAPETRSDEEIAVINDVHRQVEAYVLEWFDLFYQGEVISPAVCEELYAADRDHHVKKNGFDDWGRFELNSKNH